MNTEESTIVLFSHPGEHKLKNIESLAREDGVDFLDAPVVGTDSIIFRIPHDAYDESLGRLDDIALSEGLGLSVGDEILRFGDEDINFTIKARGDEDARIGVSRFGLDRILGNMIDDEDFIIITRFDISDPANESNFIQARSFSELTGWTMEYGEDGREYKTIVADADRAATAILRWMNGESTADLNWEQS